MDSTDLNREFSPEEFRRYAQATTTLAQLVGQREICWQQLKYWVHELDDRDEVIRQQELIVKSCDLDGQLAAILTAQEAG